MLDRVTASIELEVPDAARGRAQLHSLLHRRPDGRTTADRRAQVERIHRTFAGLAADRFPIITAPADEMVTGGGDERFRFAIDLVIDGAAAAGCA
jgi:hypothetical protein